MNRKTKTIFKIAVPVAIMVQLTAIIVLLSTNKAFSCKAVGNYFVCKQIRLK